MRMYCGHETRCISKCCVRYDPVLSDEQPETAAEHIARWPTLADATSSKVIVSTLEDEEAT